MESGSCAAGPLHAQPLQLLPASSIAPLSRRPSPHSRCAGHHHPAVTPAGPRPAPRNQPITQMYQTHSAPMPGLRTSASPAHSRGSSTQYLRSSPQSTGSAQPFRRHLEPSPPDIDLPSSPVSQAPLIHRQSVPFRRSRVLKVARIPSGPPPPISDSAVDLLQFLHTTLLATQGLGYTAESRLPFASGQNSRIIRRHHSDAPRF
mmetsp:Transcript_43486/g.91068  ORF Transcript_43486/g.91068 Transcript_43486/m.91068 type:complete len:204 (-) Transcript_43486:83-694(-)